MASGDTLLVFTPLGAEFPAANFPTYDTRNNHPVLDFDATTDEECYFKGILPRHYDGGGITVYVHYAMSSATTDEVVLAAAFERIGDSVLDIDSDSFASEQSATPTVPGTSGYVDIVSIAFTDGAQIDSLAVGESFRLKIKRDADNANDDAAGDLELFAVELKES